MRHVLLIPGVGGHPSFHRRLIDGLSDRFRVHTAPHGDFFRDPYRTLTAHAEYWAGQARQIPSQELRVLAVSFGAHVLPGLLDRLEVRPASVVLISPWMQGSLARIGIGLFSKAPERLAARWLARRLMGWTDRRSDHAREIARLRDELYDDPLRVAKRWRARVLAIADPGGVSWQWVARTAAETPTTLVFGADEWLYRMQRSRLASAQQSSPALRVVKVVGGHDVGTFATRAMVDATFEALM